MPQSLLGKDWSLPTPADTGSVSIICRFVSILGERYTHGHVIDFYTALKHDPNRIKVLGNGKQEKSYLYVGDCVAAMLATVDAHHADRGSHVYNLGTDETVVVDDSLRIITDHLDLSPRVEYAGGERGWIGDTPSHSPRHDQDLLAWLGTRVDHSAGDSPHSRMVRRKRFRLA